MKWLFKNYENITLAGLTGFVLGSLNKIWPWKQALSTRIDRHGKEVTVEATSILPTSFDGDPQLIGAIILAIIGFALIFLLEKAAGNKINNAD